MSVAAQETDLLSSLPFIRRLSPEIAQLVVRLFQRRHFDFGELVVTEGDEADGMYVVAQGSARVVTMRDGVELSLDRIHEGQWFGEAALLGETTRNASVRASEGLEVFFLDRLVFDALLATHPEVREALVAQGRLQDLNRLLRIESRFDGLAREDVNLLEERLRPVEVESGTEVLRQGADGEGLFIVARGRLEAVREEEGEERKIGFFRTGDIFGERSLVTEEPCVATVRALTDTALLRLSRDDFHELSAASAGFAERIGEVLAARDYRTEARVPLDFELEILPAGLSDEHPSDEPSEETVSPPPPPPRRRGRHRRRLSLVRQIDEMDCGVACLTMVAHWHGIDVSPSFLRDAAGTSTSGTTLRSLATTGRLIGLDVEARKVSRSRVSELPLPAIIHWDGNHWVVLSTVSEGKAEIADPARGIRRLSSEEMSSHWDGFAAVITSTTSGQPLQGGKPNLRWLRPFLRAHRKSLALALACALAAAACEVALPLVVEAVVDDVVSIHRESALDVLGLVMLALVLGGTFAALLQRLVLVASTARFDIDTLDFVTERLLGLPLSYFMSRRTGDIERRLSGVREIRRIVVQLGIQALTDGTQVVAGIAIMFVLSPLLAALFLVTAPLYVAALRYSAVRLRPLYAGIEESFGRYASDQVDLLKGIETVKSTGTEMGLRRRLQKGFADLIGQTSSSYRTIAGFGSALQLISLVTYSVFVFAGSILVHDHRLGVGAFVAFTTLVMLTTGPLISLLSIWDDVQVSTVLLNRIADVLEHEPEQGREREQLRRVRSLEGHLQLVDLTYQPAQAEEPILSGITLTVEPGTTVGVVGRSGSGKSTLLRLVAGLIEPTGGLILFDHVDSSTLNHVDLRRQLGLVLQQPYVFSLSIAENIALGDDEPDLEGVHTAAEIADLAELVSRLPLGYDTLVGDRGLPLSGGQAQRLAIARALYRQPPVLLFDEATSALDTESEATVKRNIERLLVNRTAFVVAHRLSTIRDADLIVVLERGRLVELGSHEELIERKGIYYYLHTQQLGGI